MNSSYIQRQVVRTSRNLLAVNGLVLGLVALFAVLMFVGVAAIRREQGEGMARIHKIDGSDVLQASDAVDLSHPTTLSPAEVGKGRLAQLEGKAVTLTAPQAVNLMVPVERWISRATGKRQPTHPPTYFVLQATGGRAMPGGPPSGIPGMLNPMGGPALTLIPGDYVPVGGQPPVFTGIVRPLQDTDRRVVENLLRSRGVQSPPLPYVVDCLNIGKMRVDPSRKAAEEAAANGLSGALLAVLLPFVPLAALCAWNVLKALRRLKDPTLHPIYSRLARYGAPADMVRSIDRDLQRGAQRIGPAEVTPGWLLVSSFWSLDAAPLDWIVWIYRPRKLRLRRTMVFHYVIASFTLIFLDRTGKTHAVRGGDGRLNELLAAVVRGRPWMETGEPNPLRQQYGPDRAGFIAAVEARRHATVGGPTPPPVP